MDRTLNNQLLPVARRFHFRRVLLAVALVWIFGATIAGFLYFANRLGYVDPAPFWWPLVITTGIVTLLVFWLASRTTKTMSKIANELERQFPDLDSTLLTAIEQKPVHGQQFGFLQRDVMRRAVAHSFQNSWPATVPGWQMFATPLVAFVALISFTIGMAGLAINAKELPLDPTIEFTDAAIDVTNLTVSVEPGNTSVERGTSLLVLARFGEGLPPETTLTYSAAGPSSNEVTKKNGDNSVATTLVMSKSLEDPVFGARIPSIQGPLRYQVQYADQSTEWYDVTVFDVPRLIRADAEVSYPSYTEITSKTIQDFRRISAVQGSTVEVSFYVNKQIASANLISTTDPEFRIELNEDSNDPKKMSTRIAMDESQKYELHLIDSDGRTNRTPPRFVFNVLANKEPDLKLASPTRDVQASPLEEIQLSATAWDDFGIKSLGLSYVVAGKTDQEIELEQKPVSKKRIKAEHLLALEDLEVQPDDLVSYYFWAEDIGPDGDLRRVASDMFFAEVRHFEEIFREGEPPPGGQQQQQEQQQSGQSAQQAQELAELQKEIIGATWKLIRREKGEPSPDFIDDAQVIRDSQKSAIEQLDAMAEELTDEASKAFVETARTFMNEAVVHLNQATRGDGVETLKPAIVSEQSAYQSLLKLRAREHEIVMQQQQQQSPGQAGQQNNRQQEQLDQLNLEQEENRYETERTAQEQNQQQQEQTEDRQILSRLRELARRQSDLNDRIKELQNALEEAKDESEKEEIEKRLKSLREQQEQMLRDAEELLDRMQQSENQERLSEETDQLEQARENIQRASEALEENEVSRAAAEGTRAQRDLEDLRDEFQNRTAGQFAEEMRELRNQAQKLEDNQNKIADQLAENPKTNDPANDQKSLRDDGKPDVREQLTEQKEAVEKIRQKMKETIEEAETFEPLLAEDLYDTYRDSEVSRPDRALESARRSLDRGWLSDAQEDEQRARQGIEEIREGIESAAESILGDETQALRAAQESLKDLQEQLEGEIESETGRQQDSSSDEGNPDSNQTDSQESEQERSGQQPSGNQPSSGDQQSSGNQQPSENQQSSNPSSENEDPQDSQGRGGSPSEGENENQGQRDQQERNNSPSESGNQQSENQQNQGNAGGQNQQGEREQLRDQIRSLGNPDAQEDQQDDGLNLNTGGGNLRMMRPITGEDFRDWSDRLRDVEEMVTDPDLRAEASRIREQAREIRKDIKRHSAKPNWDLIKLKVADPLAELQDRVADEILRRSDKKSLVPLDRDPVPVEYRDAVRKYYERLGRGK